MLVQTSAPPIQTNQVHRVVQFVESRLDRPFGIRDICEEVGVSYFYLQHQFADSMGESLGQFIRRLRLEHAFGYLKHSAYSVGDIGELVGYGSKHSFSKAFSQEFNHAPSAVRRKADLFVPDSLAGDAQGMTELRTLWRRQMLENRYSIQHLPPSRYYFQFLGYPNLPQGEAGFLRRLIRLFELQPIIGGPVVLSSSNVGCAASKTRMYVKGGFLVEGEAKAAFLSRMDFLNRPAAGGRFLLTRFEASRNAGGLMPVAIIEESVRESLLHIRDHESWIVIDPARPDQLEIRIPVR
ncbi:helix-turn-helix transcriptional regulator [Larkinella soli]|uniref:helix-turn-helix transcriptional regulator n=1 Tax=Larkinella soli TaxID=1770527 RepID=UPI0013E35B7E|nr:AraC family transcriptional regulator [Larkinella soli]